MEFSVITKRTAQIDECQLPTPKPAQRRRQQERRQRQGTVKSENAYDLDSVHEEETPTQESAKKKSPMSYSETSTIYELSDDHDVRKVHNSVNRDKFILRRAELQRLETPPYSLPGPPNSSDSSDLSGSSDSGEEKRCLDDHRDIYEAMKKAGMIVAEFAKVGHVETSGTKQNKHKVIGKNGHTLGTVVARNYTSVLDRVFFWNERRSCSMVKGQFAAVTSTTATSVEVPGQL
ncbi:uncharacterized protein J4E88_004302 [Alternaria novae-zelandiae]|uniref:uncharacterized protein n=1 Tax=Alternaria novae-zelandiae TaxID=430562 RepID=UPI0020C4F682|nr:uncharacterized protein J4E88_004302 [Alternaria novae-zelandiae]KAI4684860.1 hypothetical protein J4E88_004302 [Alternaria novae-zelandiae]